MKILQGIRRFLYALPFGLKAADKEILSSDSITSDGMVIEIGQEVNDKRVSKHLLKGEITQEVEELRYRNYKVEDASKDYEYIGDGQAVKHERVERDLNKIKFTQENKINVTTVLEEMQRVGSYGTETYVMECTYTDFPRFRLEQFMTSVYVDINNHTNEIYTTLYFNDSANPYDSKSRPFVNELQKLMTINVNNDTAINKNDIASTLKTLSFSTYKANGEDDFVNYAFINGAKLVKTSRDNGFYSLTFKWNEYIRVPLDLLNKYFSDSMEEKYKNVEKKDVELKLVDVEEKHFCEICGKEVNQRDYEVLKYEKMPILCTSCLKKYRE